MSFGVRTDAAAFLRYSIRLSYSGVRIISVYTFDSCHSTEVRPYSKNKRLRD